MLTVQAGSTSPTGMMIMRRREGGQGVGTALWGPQLVEGVRPHSRHLINGEVWRDGRLGEDRQKNKPAAQAAGADPSRCNFTTR